jgi:hypothetical protein
MTFRSAVLAGGMVLLSTICVSAQGRGMCQIKDGTSAPATTTITMRMPNPGFGMNSCAFSLTRNFPSALVDQVALKGIAVGDVQALRISPRHGTVETFDGTVRYTPDPGYLGQDIFSIDVEHADLGASVAKVSTLNFVVSTY